MVSNLQTRTGSELGSEAPVPSAAAGQMGALSINCIVVPPPSNIIEVTNKQKNKHLL